MDIVEFVLFMVLIGITFVSIIILLRMVKDRDRSKVLHQLSDKTFAMISGTVKGNKLEAKNLKFDLVDIEVYNLRTLWGFKPFYVTSHGRNRPLQIKGGFLTSDDLDPETVKALGKIETLKQLISAKVRGGQSSRAIIAVSVMMYIMGLLTVLAFMGVKTF